MPQPKAVRNSDDEQGSSWEGGSGNFDSKPTVLSQNGHGMSACMHVENGLGFDMCVQISKGNKSLIPLSDPTLQPSANLEIVIPTSCASSQQQSLIVC